MAGLIVEFDGGGDYGGFDFGGYGAGAGMGMWGAMGSTEGLISTFVKPFTDVLVTAVGKTKELSRSAQNLLNVTFETLVTTLIPIYSDSFDEIFEKERADIDKIRQKYRKVYESNIEMFSDSDMGVLAYAFNPASYITSQFISAAPKTALKMIEVLTGDNEHVKKVLNNVKRLYSLDVNESFACSKHSRLLLERTKKKLPPLASVLSSKEIVDAVKASPVTKEMMRDAKKVARQAYEAMLADVRELSRAQTLSDIQRATGKQLAAETKRLNDLPQNERAAAERAIVSTLKKSVKKLYSEKLRGQLERLKQLRVPESAEYYQLVSRAIDLVERLV